MSRAKSHKKITKITKGRKVVRGGSRRARKRHHTRVVRSRTRRRQRGGGTTVTVRIYKRGDMNSEPDYAKQPFSTRTLDMGDGVGDNVSSWLSDIRAKLATEYYIESVRPAHILSNQLDENTAQSAQSFLSQAELTRLATVSKASQRDANHIYTCVVHDTVAEKVVTCHRHTTPTDAEALAVDSKLNNTTGCQIVCAKETDTKYEVFIYGYRKGSVERLALPKMYYRLFLETEPDESSAVQVRVKPWQIFYNKQVSKKGIPADSSTQKYHIDEVETEKYEAAVSTNQVVLRKKEFEITQTDPDAKYELYMCTGLSFVNYTQKQLYDDLVKFETELKQASAATGA
jgi:hypothetical protein